MGGIKLNLYITAADRLLGEPIRKEIESHTGISVAFESVGAICASKFYIVVVVDNM